MTFDPFRDFEERGYLRNLYGSKDVAAVKALEQKSFKKNLKIAIDALIDIQFIEYKHILGIHQTLFGDIYPWAGQDRLATVPDLNITKGGYERMFAHPRDIRRAGEYAPLSGSRFTFYARTTWRSDGTTGSRTSFLRRQWTHYYGASRRVSTSSGNKYRLETNRQDRLSG
jgi:fido (protein-threonine AMPylation protein)